MIPKELTSGGIPNMLKMAGSIFEGDTVLFVST
jgi:hypothetical protein